MARDTRATTRKVVRVKVIKKQRTKKKRNETKQKNSQQKRGNRTVNVHKKRGEEKQQCKCHHNKTKLKKNNQKTPEQSTKQSKFGSKNDHQENTKVIWSTTSFTRRLLVMGERILDFGEYLQKQLRVLKSVELHPSDPKLGFICFTHAAPIKRLEKILLSSGIKGLQVRASERMNRWKEFFQSPNDFFPDYQRLRSIQPEHNNQTQQSYQQNSLNVNNTTAATVESNQKEDTSRPNRGAMMQPQQIITIKSEDDGGDQYPLGVKQELEPPPPSFPSTNNYEKQELQQQQQQQQTSNLASNSNSNQNQSSSSLSSGVSCSQFPSPQLTTSSPSSLNQSSIKFHSLSSLNNMCNSQHFETKPMLSQSKPLISYNESQIYVEITQILRRNRSWESLLELVRYIESSEWISSTRKAQMLFAIGEKREALENVMQLNQLYGQEKMELA